MNYEELSSEAYQHGITVEEYDLQAHDGLCYGNLILIDKNITTETEKADILAEELGHYYTSTGDILDQSKAANRKQEHKARLWAYNRQIGLCGIIAAAKVGCRNRYEVAKHLEVTEELLQDAIDTYKSKYGVGTQVDNYWITFIPYLKVGEIKEFI